MRFRGAYVARCEQRRNGSVRLFCGLSGHRSLTYPPSVSLKRLLAGRVSSHWQAGTNSSMGITPRSFRHPIRSLVRESIVSALAMLAWKNRDRIIGQARSMMGSKHQKSDTSRPLGDPFVPTVADRPSTLFEAGQAESAAPLTAAVSKQYESMSETGIHDISDEAKAE